MGETEKELKPEIVALVVSGARIIYDAMKKTYCDSEKGCEKDMNPVEKKKKYPK